MSISFRIFNDSNLTIAEQICQQIELAIAKGELKQNERLPSVRQLAVQLKVNPNTVASALQTLVSTGSLTSQKGKGYFVSAPSNTLSKEETERRLSAAAKQFVATTRPLGLSNQQLITTILTFLPEDKENNDD